MSAYEPLDPGITLTTLLRESDYQSYGYELPGNAPQVMGVLVARYFDLNPHALVLTCISILEYINLDDPEWPARHGNITKLD
jgi:hypothetical protein